MRYSNRPAAAVVICLWCDHEFSPRKSGGSPQRFCCPEHRRAFHIAAHQFVLAEFSADRLTVAEIKKFAGAGRISLPLRSTEIVLGSFSSPGTKWPEG